MVSAYIEKAVFLGPRLRGDDGQQRASMLLPALTRPHQIGNSVVYLICSIAKDELTSNKAALRINFL